MYKLSPKAAAAKKKRDLATAKTPRRTAMKAENQRKRRAAKKAGRNVDGKDYDHNRGRFVSTKTNRSATKTTNNTMTNGKKKPIKPVKGKVTISGKATPKKRTMAELAKKAKESGWKPTPRKKRKTLKEMAKTAKKSPTKRISSAKKVGKTKLQAVPAGKSKSSVFKRIKKATPVGKAKLQPVKKATAKARKKR